MYGDRMRPPNEPVKPLLGAGSTAGKRNYRSDVRVDRARATRRAIVRAAAKLFQVNGYAATTMEAIAETAGVSRKTVFTAGGSKFELLKNAFDWSLVGDDEPIAMADREPVQRILATTDQVEAVRMWAAMITETAARAAPIGAVLVAAAHVDPQAADLLRISDRHRHEGAQAFVAQLDAHGGLRAGLTIDEAADLCWLANDPVSFTRLVQERGWTPERFRDRLASMISWELLGR